MPALMWSFIHKGGSPKTAYRWAGNLQPWVAAIAIILFAYGLFAALYLSPADYQQGNVYRIIYLHVPAAIWSLGVYTGMTIAVIFFFIWKLKVADMIAKVSAPIGASLTALTLITGSIWGKPTWGTYWIWDARLTSELLLLFIYFGVMAIRSAIPDRQLAAKASGVVTIVGFVNIPIIHYSVDWWHTLHQGATINFFSNSTIVPSMMHPLMAMIFAFMFYIWWLVIIRLRREILQREEKTSWVRDIILKKFASS